MDFLLTPAQFDACTSSAKCTVFLAGLGSGKTTAIAATILSKGRYPGTVIGLFAPTRKMLTKAVLKTFKQTWEWFGLREGFDYTVNKRPPSEWNVKPITLGNMSGIITTKWGCSIIYDGLDNFDSQRGQEYDCVFIDEFRDVKYDALDVLEGRLRGNKYKELGLQHQIFIFTTPPDNPQHIESVINREGTRVIHATSYSNQTNLPPGYIESLKARMSELQFKREVLAELVPLVETPFAYAFNPSLHVRESIKWGFGNKLLSFDFNVNPATVTFWEYDEMYTYCIDEIRMENVSIHDVCNEIRWRYPNYIGEWEVTGDASGNNRSGLSRGLSTYYKVIQEELDISRRNMRVPSVNETHKESYFIVNAVLERRNIVIHPRCEHTIQDLRLVNYNPDKGIDKTNSKIGHLLDTFRYALHLIHKKDIYKKDI